MPSRLAHLLGAACLLACAAARPVAAQFDKVTYALQEGSYLIDGCGDCGRPDVPLPLSGTFSLERLPVKIVGELYELSDLQIVCTACDLDLQGTGRIHRPDFETLTPSLDLTIDGVSSIQLQADNAPAVATWPLFDITVKEDGSRDPSHVYTLRLVAAPRVDMIPYELVPGDIEAQTGTILEIVCITCRLRYPFIPLQGTLQVGQVSSTLDGFDTYRLDQLRFTDIHPAPDVDFAITGAGEYQQGGDFALTQRIRLALAINGELERVLESSMVIVGPGGALPNIDINSEETIQDNLWYRLHLVARPATEERPRFRRGDSNADGKLDLADPVFHLSWLFSGAGAPSCLEASDADGDGQHNLTDAIYSLGFLFLGGPAPPAPGPVDCGEGGDLKFGCASYPGC